MNTHRSDGFPTSQPYQEPKRRQTHSPIGAELEPATESNQLHAHWPFSTNLSVAMSTSGRLFSFLPSALEIFRVLTSSSTKASISAAREPFRKSSKISSLVAGPVSRPGQAAAWCSQAAGSNSIQNLHLTAKPVSASFVVVGNRLIDRG